jgi:hypothetical protein
MSCDGAISAKKIKLPWTTQTTWMEQEVLGNIIMAISGTERKRQVAHLATMAEAT